MQTKRLVSVALVLTLFFLLPIVNAQYYSGLGTHNLEKGVNQPLTVEANKSYQLYVARLDNTGNVNLTILIKTDVTFTNDGTTIKNPNFTKISFIGKNEYTLNQIDYPFFLTPDMQLQVWLNVTLNEPGNYTFNFETDSEPQLPEGYTGPISVSNGKFNAKLTAESPKPFTIFGFPATHVVGVGLGTALLTVITLYALIHHIRKKAQTVKPEMVTIDKKVSRKEYMKKYMRDRRSQKREERRKQREAQTQSQ